MPIKPDTSPGAVMRREPGRRIEQPRTLLETGPTRVLKLYVHPKSEPVHLATSPAGAPYLTLREQEGAEITAAWAWTTSGHALVDIEERWK